MHPPVLQWVRHSTAGKTYERVLELGSLDINGSTRALFPDVAYVGVDRQQGPGVDIVSDILDLPGEPKHAGVYDLVLSTEALEHTLRQQEIVEVAYWALRPGGMFVGTCAAPGRSPHSGIDEAPIRDFEEYRNVPPEDMRTWLDGWSLSHVEVEGMDLRWWAIK